MVPPEPDKRDNRVRGSGSWSKSRLQPDFFASIVSVEAVCHFCRRGSGGDRAAGWVALQQLGLVATRQLVAAGISRDAIRTRRRRGSLHIVYQGVYLLGHAVMAPGTRELAAVLACGEGAFVSHRSAASLWGFAAAPEGATEVTVVGRNIRSRDGLRVHRVRSLNNADRRLRNGIPVTSPARALIDFASQAAADELERAITEAYALGLTTERELRQALARNANRAGVAALKVELDREGGPAFTRSEAERRMLALIRDARLPRPLTNVPVEGYEVDLLWPEHRLIVEIDGYRFHGHRQAFERDRRKQTALAAAGYTMIRVRWRQIDEGPMAVVAAIAQALARARSGSRERH
jgi:very-short-patch-repair endonuclease